MNKEPTCRNPICPLPLLPGASLHDGGYCSVCCPTLGDGGCELCWGASWDELEDEEDPVW